MNDVIDFPKQAPLTANPEQGNPFHDLEGEICDCESMSLIAARMMLNADNGQDRELVFAVVHLSEMLSALKKAYLAAWEANEGHS
jgi:hypothetical protein